MNIPFDTFDLKKAYKNAARKHHPDLGGDEDDMKILNDAYLIYNDFLAWEQYSKLDTDSDTDIVKYFSITNGKTFYADLFGLLITIYVDIWELEKAEEFLTYLLESDFFHSDICSEDFMYKISFFKQILTLSKKLTIVKKYDMAKIFFEKSLYYQDKCQYDSLLYYFEDVENIIARRKKPRVVITHILQADNAYKLNIITEKKHKAYVEKFSEIISKQELSIKLFDEYLIDNNFIQLPFDKNIKYSSLEQYIPNLNSSLYNQVIYEISTEQQNEYYSTFYLNPSLSLIKKYLSVRLCSYILSIEKYEDGISYLPTILQECDLFNKIYENETITYNYRKIFIKMFIEDLKTMINLNESQYELRYKQVRSRFCGYFPGTNTRRTY